MDADQSTPITKTEVSTSYYMGMDRSTYPGDSNMQTWWTYSPMYWTGFYLAPAPHHSNTGWMTKRSLLKGQGWGLAPIYVGRQAGDGGLLTTAQGKADAQNASALATQAGFPYGWVFLDVEQGGTLTSAFMNYITGWLNEIYANTPFNPGVYCSFSHTADQIHNATGGLNTMQFWCYNVNCPPSPGCAPAVLAPSGCGVSYAADWQFAQSPKPAGINCPGYTSGQCSKTYGGVTLAVDLNTSIYSNPSRS